MSRRIRARWVNQSAPAFTPDARIMAGGLSAVTDLIARERYLRGLDDLLSGAGSSPSTCLGEVSDSALAQFVRRKKTVFAFTTVVALIPGLPAALIAGALVLGSFSDGEEVYIGAATMVAAGVGVAAALALFVGSGWCAGKLFVRLCRRRWVRSLAKKHRTPEADLAEAVRVFL